MDPRDGNVVLTGNSVGDSANYVCSPGFELIGDETATCTSDMEESGASFRPASPTCRGKKFSGLHLYNGSSEH